MQVSAVEEAAGGSGEGLGEGAGLEGATHHVVAGGDRHVERGRARLGVPDRAAPVRGRARRTRWGGFLGFRGLRVLTFRVSCEAASNLPDARCMRSQAVAMHPVLRHAFMVISLVIG